jgi:hypothetical protein
VRLCGRDALFVGVAWLDSGCSLSLALRRLLEVRFDSKPVTNVDNVPSNFDDVGWGTLPPLFGGDNRTGISLQSRSTAPSNDTDMQIDQIESPSLSQLLTTPSNATATATVTTSIKRSIDDDDDNNNSNHHNTSNKYNILPVSPNLTGSVEADKIFFHNGIAIQSIRLFIC